MNCVNELKISQKRIMSSKVLITSALPYANGPLHFGHIAGAYLPADCYARYQRLQGSDVLFLCGSDEHGVAVTMSAELAGRTPQEQVDIFHKLNKDLFNALGISFDHYSRTTWEGHAKTTCEFFKDLLENGYIEEKVTEQLYSERDDRFLADRYVIGTCPKCGFDEARGDECTSCGASYEATDLKNPRSKTTGAPLVGKDTKHWFLRFDKFKEELKSWLNKKEWKSNVVNFVSHYIDDLRPRAITRDSNWGIPVPLDNAEGKVFYVWFDAPIGYISAAREWAEKQGNPDLWKEYWLGEDTRLINFIGKDNIPFHAIFFPAMCMGQNQPYAIVDDLPANEFLNLEGKQFSKSAGWTIDLETFFNRFSSYQIRYYLASIAPENNDSEFSWKGFQGACNSDLVGKFGNLANRTLTFLQKVGGKVPAQHDLHPTDEQFLLAIRGKIDEISLCYASYNVRKATQLIMELSHIGNAYFDSKEPWRLKKDEKCKEQLETTLNLCLSCLKLLALAISPLTPNAAQKLWELLGLPGTLNDHKWETVVEMQMTPDTPLKTPEILFPKVEDETINAELEKLKSQVESDQIDFSDFTKVKLVVAKITHAEPVPKSSRLLKLAVDIGTETRTVVSGIAEKYTPDDLLDKNVILVSNLKPAKLMGILSEGMILATGKGKTLVVPFLPAEIPPGTPLS